MILHVAPPRNTAPPAATKMQEHTYLLSGLDTLPCAFVHQELAVPGTPYVTYLLGFGSPLPAKNVKLVIDAACTSFSWEFLIDGAMLAKYGDTVRNAMKATRS